MIAFLRDLIVRDFWLKLFSLVLAVLIWLTVAFGKDFFADRGLPEQTYYNIPVSVMFSAANADMHGFIVDPSAVTVTVRGDKKSLNNLQARDIRALVDLTGIETASRGLRKRIEVTTPAGITFVKVDPDEVEVIIPSAK